MLKRTIAWMLVLTLVMSVMPQLSLGVTAEGEQAIPAAHSHSATQHNCEHCEETITWQAWDKTDSLPSTSGHYYLTADVKPTGQAKLTGTTDMVLCLNGYTINGEDYNGTPLYVQDTAKLTVSDCTAYTDAEGVLHAGMFTKCRAGGAMPTAIYAKHNTQVAVYNCIISDSHSVKGSVVKEGQGGAIQMRGDQAGDAPVLYLENVVFDGNTAVNSVGALSVYGSTTTPVVTVKNCTFKNNSAPTGGAVYLTKANATFEKCTIEENSAEFGGAIYAVSSTLYMKNCTITGNKVSKDSAGNIQNKTTTAVFEGCTIENNEAVGTAGSAFYIHGGNSKVTLKDTSVINNRHTGTKTTARAGIYVTNKSDKLIVEGKTVVDGNLIATGGDAIERNIFVQTSPNSIDVGGLTNGASISVWTNWGTDETPTFVTAATAPAAWSSAWVLYENNGMAVDYNETDKFHFVENLVHEHCICGITGCANTEHEKVLFQPWTGKTELPTSGAYYLTEDVSLDGAAALSEDVTICLNGHTVTQTKADNRVITVTAGNVRITGCKGGTITGGKSTGYGGGITANASAAELELYNITITGNTAKTNGGGVDIHNKAKLTMSGCTVTGNESVNDGGGLYAQKETEVTVTNTEFTSNTVTDGAGGGVAISGKATLTNLTIKKNKSVNGGGLIVQGEGNVTMNGGVISENEVTKNGGGVYASKKLTIDGTSITGNKAKTGDGIYVAATDVLTVTGDTVIKDNPGNNLYISSTHNIAFDKLTSKAYISIGVKDNAPRAITGQLTQDPTAYLHSDSADLQPVYKDGVVYLEAAVKHSHCLCGGAGTGCDHSTVNFTAWDKTDSLPTTSGHYYLTADVTPTAQTKLTGSNDVVICLNGYNISGEKAGASILYVQDTAKLTITDCTAYTDDAGVFHAGAIKNGNAYGAVSGAIYAKNSCDVTLYNCIFTGNKLNKNKNSVVGFGGAVQLRGDLADKASSLYMENVVFDSNVSGQSAGALCVVGSKTVPTVTVKNCTFKNNSALEGGAAYLTKADVTFDNCTFTGNTATGDAGIYATGSTKLTIKDSQITDNTAAVAGGVYVSENSSLTLEGVTKISGNAGGNLLLVGGTLMDVSAVTEGTEVWLTADMGPISTPCEDLSKYFKSESVYRGVIYKDGALYMATDGSHKHCFCLGKASGCDHEVVEWVAWESTNSLPASGNYYLLNDVVLTAEQSITSDVNICLNGKTVTAADGQRHISTVKGDAAHIVICDCTATTVDGVYTAGKLTGGVHKTTNTGGGSIYLRSGGSVELFDGIICGNTSDLAGGAIAMNSGAAFTMHGGEISGNTAFKTSVDENGAEVVEWKDGGGIFSAPNNDVKILGGTIKNNEGLGGAGLRFSGKGDLLIAGGTITGNVGHGQGGGVFASSTTVTITGGQIIGNKSTSSAGGLCLGTKAVATMTGGLISGNSSVTAGGFVVQGGAVLTMTGGEVSGNTATGNGGGGALYSAAELHMYGGKISNNNSQKDGGGVYANKAGVYLYDQALISGNKVGTGSGGGVSFGGNSYGKISGGIIEKNTTVKGGGAGMIVQNKAEVEITNVTVRNNTAYSSGGGVWSYKATLTIKGGTFQGNKSTKSSGGGINASSESVFTMTGGTVKNNSAKTTGGGISVNKCTANLSGVTVTGNYCERDGAGIYNTAGVMNIRGGVVSAYNTTKGNGGGFCYGSKSSGYISGMSVYGNSVDGGGGGAIIQNKANVTIGYISMTGNNAKKTSGGIYLYKATLTMTGGKIAGNTAGKQGGGIYATDSETVKLSNVTVSKNTGSTGGGLYMYRTKLILKDSVISENISKGSGTGIYSSGGTWKAALAGGEITNTKIVGNQGGVSCSGGAVYMNADVEFTFTDCEITDNYSENYCGGIYCASGGVPTVINCTFTGNESLKNGGALYTGDTGTIIGCVFKDNKADKGAGLFVGNYMERWACNGWGNKRLWETGVTITDCTFEGNKATTDGGGFHLDMSAYTTMDNCTFTGNSAGVAGSAMWLWENCTMTNLTVTGNVCANNGHALVLADSEFDGQTYINGLFKMGGDMIIKDNEGGDLYLDYKTTIGALAQGYGPKTHMNVTLDEGLLTQRVDGAYNYEGGDLVYTITYGERSLTDPEYDPNLVAKPAATEQTQQNHTAKTDILLYVGIGVIGLAAIAGAVLVIAKKKKSASAETK